MSDTRDERVGGANAESVGDETDDRPGDEQNDDPETDTSHLDGVDDGCGCAGVWEHLSEQREE